MDARHRYILIFTLIAAVVFIVVLRNILIPEPSEKLVMLPDLIGYSDDEPMLFLQAKINGRNTTRHILTGWDFRDGAGENSRRLGTLDSSVYRSPPVSVRLDPSSNADFGIEDEGLDRSIWPLDRFPVEEGDTIILRGYAKIGVNNQERTLYWVDPRAAGDTLHGPHDCPGGIQDHDCPYVSRGGARAGIDLRDSTSRVFDYDMRIIDWTMDPNKWYYFEMKYVAKPGTVSVMPWLQGYEATAPSAVWFDDVELIIYDN